MWHHRAATACKHPSPSSGASRNSLRLLACQNHLSNDMRWLAFTIATLFSAISVAAPMQSALHPVGPQAAHILDLWHVTLAICTLVMVAIVAAWGYALWRAPRADEKTAPDLTSM